MHTERLDTDQGFVPRFSGSGLVDFMAYGSGVLGYGEAIVA